MDNERSSDSHDRISDQEAGDHHIDNSTSSLREKQQAMDQTESTVSSNVHDIDTRFRVKMDHFKNRPLLISTTLPSPTQLPSKYAELDFKNTRLQQERVVAEDLISTLEIRIAELEAELSGETKNKNLIELRLREITEAQDRSADEVASLDHQNQQLKQRNEFLAQQTSILQKGNEGLMEIKVDLELRIQNETATNKNLNMQISTLSQDFTQLNIEYTQAQEHIIFLSSQIERQEMDLEIAQSWIEAAKAQQLEMDQDLASLERLRYSPEGMNSVNHFVNLADELGGDDGIFGSHNSSVSLASRHQSISDEDHTLTVIHAHLKPLPSQLDRNRWPNTFDAEEKIPIDENAVATANLVDESNLTIHDAQKPVRTSWLFSMADRIVGANDIHEANSSSMNFLDISNCDNDGGGYNNTPLDQEMPKNPSRVGGWLSRVFADRSLYVLGKQDAGPEIRPSCHGILCLGDMTTTDWLKWTEVPSIKVINWLTIHWLTPLLLSLIIMLLLFGPGWYEKRQWCLANTPSNSFTMDIYSEVIAWRNEFWFGPSYWEVLRYDVARKWQIGYAIGA